MSSRISLIVGLGNPGASHENTRHNAGFWFVDKLVREASGNFRSESKFHAEVCKAHLNGQQCWLCKPDTYMNRSGQAVAAIAKFYKIPLDEILIVYDEIDLPPGTVRLKKGGGHGGHNGMRDVISHLGSKDFLRLRIGVGHPGHSDQVSDYVLGKPSKADRRLIDDTIDAGLAVMPLVVKGDIETAMQRLHTT